MKNFSLMIPVTPLCRSSATTPTTVAHGRAGALPRRMRPPTTADGSVQYVRAIVSLTTATGTLAIVSASVNQRPRTRRVPIASNAPCDTTCTSTLGLTSRRFLEPIDIDAVVANRRRQRQGADDAGGFNAWQRVHPLLQLVEEVDDVLVGAGTSAPGIVTRIVRTRSGLKPRSMSPSAASVRIINPAPMTSTTARATSTATRAPRSRCRRWPTVAFWPPSRSDSTRSTLQCPQRRRQPEEQRRHDGQQQREGDDRRHRDATAASGGRLVGSTLVNTATRRRRARPPARRRRWRARRFR